MTCFMFENINVYKCVYMSLGMHLSKVLGQTYITHCSDIIYLWDYKEQTINIRLNFTHYIFVLYLLIL